MRRLVPTGMAAAVAVALTACGGGGGSAPAGSLPGTTSSAPPGVTSGTPVAATFTLRIPQLGAASSQVRRRQFLSPNTATINLALTSVNGTAVSGPAVSVTIATSSDCATASNITTCSIPMDVAPGNDVFSATILDANNNVLGTALVPETIVTNATNALALTLNGVIASLSLYSAKARLTAGAADSTRVYLVALDASGAQVINPGNFAAPVTLAVTGGNNAVQLQDGTQSGTSVSVQTPDDAITLASTASAGGTATVTATSGSITGSTDIGIGTAPLQALSTASNAQFPGQVFSSLSQNAAFTLTGGTAPYTVTATGSATESGSGAGPFTAGASTFGTGSIVVHDNAGGVLTIPISAVAPAIVPSATGTYVVSPADLQFTAAAQTQQISFTGGNGTYTESTASGNTAIFSVSPTAGSTVTVTAQSTGSDFLVVSSGGQTAYILVGVSVPGTIGFSPTIVSADVGGAAQPITEIGTGNGFGSVTDANGHTSFSAGTFPSGTVTGTSAGSGSIAFVSPNGANGLLPYRVFDATINPAIYDTGIRQITFGSLTPQSGSAIVVVSGMSGTTFTVTAADSTVAEVSMNNSTFSGSLASASGGATNTFYVKPNPGGTLGRSTTVTVACADGTQTAFTVTTYGTVVPVQ